MSSGYKLWVVNQPVNTHICKILCNIGTLPVLRKRSSATHLMGLCWGRGRSVLGAPVVPSTLLPSQPLRSNLLSTFKSFYVPLLLALSLCSMTGDLYLPGSFSLTVLGSLTGIWLATGSCLCLVCLKVAGPSSLLVLVCLRARIPWRQVWHVPSGDGQRGGCTHAYYHR